MKGCDFTAEEQLEKRSRGRPKGTGGNKRPDRKEALSVYSNPGDNTRYVKHNLRIWDMKKPDMTSVEAVEERIKEYLTICMEDDIKPSIEGMSLAFDVSRQTFWKWANGVESDYLPAEVRNSVKKVYHFLNTQFVTYAQDGKMDRTVAIFLMKNNYGYKDEQEVVLKPDSQLGEQKDPDELQKKYLEDAYGGATIINAETAE